MALENRVSFSCYSFKTAKQNIFNFKIKSVILKCLTKEFSILNKLSDLNQSYIIEILIFKAYWFIAF